MRKFQTNAILLLVCLFLFQIDLLRSQTRQNELLKGSEVSRIIKPGEAHQYVVKLDADQFAFFKLIQEGIDVIITTYDPDGKKLEEFDSPNGSDGPEYITIVTGKKGNYILEVCTL